jgi:transcriptional regulator GlxA family with amidase domain
MRFGIFIYDGVEPIDLATFGVLSMARRIAPEIEICTIAPQAGPVALANGLNVSADFGVDDAPPCDLVIVTGGAGWPVQAQSSKTLDFIRRVHASSRIASVCTGGMILAASGVLDGGAATTKREVVPPEKPPIEVMRASYPGIDVREAMLVDPGGGRNGGIVTGGGVSLCIDTTLYLLADMLGQHVADENARIMEYQRALRANRDGFAPVLPARRNG